MIQTLMLLLPIASAIYDDRNLELRLKRLEAENAALISKLSDLKRSLPNCTAFVQTGGCNPDGDVEGRKACSETIATGLSGYCECREGAKVQRVACAHAPFTCEEACAPPPPSRPPSAGRVTIQVGGQVLTHPPIPTPLECADYRGCHACSAQPECAWCLQTRRCVIDEPWICQGDVDHVSSPDGQAPPGKPGKGRCPTPSELEAERAARVERERNAKQRASSNAPPNAPPAAARQAGGERSALDDARARAKERVVKASLTEMARMREEDGGVEGGGMDEAAAATEEEAKEAAAAAHLEELRRRVALAEEEEGGASRPYETLGLAVNCSQGAVRSAYRTLALRFHPDKNRGEALAELAHVAFQEVVAAFEVLGTPDKRAAFDEAAGSSGRFSDFGARWENQEFAWDSDMYKGAKLVTTITEKNWERRLGGDSIWLLEAYAAWCPACKAAMPKFHSTAELLKDRSDLVEVGAVNCERAGMKKHCADWLAVDAYPSFYLLSLDQTALAKYPKDAEVTAAKLASWAVDTAHGWRTHLFPASNLTNLDASSFEAAVLADAERRAWVVLFTDGLTCAPCRTALTNLMRLSASLRGLPVGIGYVDCSEDAAFCRTAHGLPERPFAPEFHGWPRGGSKPAKGDVLFRSSQIEAHRALELIDRGLRLALASERDPRVESELATAGATQGFEADPSATGDETGRQPGGGGGFQWDGPAQPRGKPIPWNGFSRPEAGRLAR